MNTNSFTGIESQEVISSNNSLIVSSALEVDIKSVLPHSKIEEVRGKREIEGLKLTMQLAGQLEPIKVVVSGSQYLIIDGICRYHAALELGWQKIKIEILSYSEDQIQEQMVIRNFKTKRSFQELIFHAEIILNVLGKSQGKRRESIGDLSCDNEDFCLAGKDRFQIACEILNVDFSATTLRRLMAVKEFEDSGVEEVKKFGLMKKIESGEMKVNSAFSILENLQSEKKEKGLNALTDINNTITNHTPDGKKANIAKGNGYTLIHGSCTDLSAIEDESIQCVVTSPPYFQQRVYDYENGYKSELGQERTVDEYIHNQVEIFSKVQRKLKGEGSLFVVIADSYEGTSLLVTQKFVIEMCNKGWYLNSEIIWKKSNPKPHAKIKRLQPSYERIFHFVKDPEKFFFREFKNWDENGAFGIVRGCIDHGKDGRNKNRSWSLKRPYKKFQDFLDEQQVLNVLIANSFNWAELSDIDSSFRHEAPYSITIPLIPILLTTKIGDKVLDIYNGTSTTVAAAVALKREGIGYEIDKKSHEFSIKRMVDATKEENLLSNAEVSEFENEYMSNQAA